MLIFELEDFSIICHASLCRLNNVRSMIFNVDDFYASFDTTEIFRYVEIQIGRFFDDLSRNPLSFEQCTFADRKVKNFLTGNECNLASFES